MTIRAEELKTGRIIHWVANQPESKYLIVGKGKLNGNWHIKHIATGYEWENYPVEAYLNQIDKVISNKKRVFK